MTTQDNFCPGCYSTICICDKLNAAREQDDKKVREMIGGLCEQAQCGARIIALTEELTQAKAESEKLREALTLTLPLLETTTGEPWLAAKAAARKALDK